MRTSWMIWYAIFMHLWWSVIIYAQGLGGSDWHGGVSWNTYVELGGLHLWAALMFIGALLALWGMFAKNRWWSLFLLLPQQFILSVVAFGMILHFFGFGHSYDSSRLWRVGALSWGVFIFHSAAILQYHAGGLWKYFSYRR